MVEVLTCPSCWVSPLDSFLLSAMTSCRRLHTTLEYFLILVDLFLFLTSVFLKDVHLYFMLQPQLCLLIGRSKDQMMVL